VYQTYFLLVVVRVISLELTLQLSTTFEVVKVRELSGLVFIVIKFRMFMSIHVINKDIKLPLY